MTYRQKTCREEDHCEICNLTYLSILQTRCGIKHTCFIAAESIIVVTANFCIALLSAILTLANAWGMVSVENRKKCH